MTHRETSQQIAVKVMPVDIVTEPVFFRELGILFDLNHPCVVRLANWCPPDQSNRAEIWTEFAIHKSLKLALERARSGDTPAFWDSTGKAIIICGIVLGMRYVHAKRYIHRDLKPANIFITAQGTALIGDFGSACCSCYDETLTPEGGTVYYSAPELCLEDTECQANADVFSFGSILFEILTGQAVFPVTRYPLPVLRRLLNHEMPIIPDIYGSQMQELIQRCWSLRPESRPAFSSILSQFEWAGFDILPDANAVQVQQYVAGIREWERHRCPWM
jgi:serine/threonine protein kinase